MQLRSRAGGEGWALPVESLLRYLLRPGARQENDASAAADRNVSRHPLALPPGLSLQWLGTAGFAIAHEGTRLLIDPFVTRPPLRPVALNQNLRPRGEAVAQHLGERADAILVGHTHYDHAMDVPVAARHLDCPVYGGRSVATLMGLWGEGARAREVEGNQPFEIGPFKVTFVPSVHSKLALGLKVTSEGEITCDHLDALSNGTFCCGQVWGIHLEVAGHSLYHLGSANLLEDEIRFDRVDTLLLGIAGRGHTPDFLPRILRATRPSAILPHHFDNFFLPLEGPMGFSFNVNLGGFLEEVHRHAPGLPVHTLELLQTTGG
ncbi:MAG: MBL fold metallo-hydrolase [Deltaproteobacteria bacterium]|nr:MBL fold metallo-hydrolase [Deltaproteobacteria bacterium]